MARLTRKLEDRLVEAALAVRQSAYAPYSRFSVGAAALSSSGAVHRGCNVENASYGLCVCAERNAVGAAVVAGDTAISAIAIATASSPPSPPCGMCRQVLAEFARGRPLDVILVNPQGERVRTTLAKLFPSNFTPALLASGTRRRGTA